MKIQNYEEIIHFSSSVRKKSRKAVLDLLSSAIEAVDPYQIVYNSLILDKEKLELISNKAYFSVKQRKLWVIGAGKAVGRMAEALEEVLAGAGLDYQGIICVPNGIKEGLNLQRIQCFECTHPLPSEVNIQNTKRVLELINRIKPKDLVFVLLSGGGSSIWVTPIDPISIDDLITLNAELIRSRMKIHEINVVRKHVSLIKGGKLAKQIPAEMLVLVISDVIGDNLESIASGPFIPDPSTFQDTKLLLEQQYLWENAIPASVKLVIERGIEGVISETLKGNDKTFQRIQTFILGSNKMACNAIVSNAKKLGLNTIFLTDRLEGDARCLGRLLARIYCGLAEGTQDPILVVSGGEPTVKVQGDGVGGRNQEVVAEVINEFLSFTSPPDILFLSAGTDGVDGNSPYSGALIDDVSISVLRQKGLHLSQFQKNNDLSRFFEKLGGSVLLMGPTGTNVMDLQIALLNVSNFQNIEYISHL